jgi:uncharacterized membrane-anchored protein
MTRLKLAAGWVGVQLLFFAGWTVREHVRMTSGASILVKVIPVDPRDLLRGQYLNLAYEFSRPWDSSVAHLAIPDDGSVWVVLRRDGPFHVPKRLSLARPTELDQDDVALQGRARGSRYTFGVEQYFVPEGTATPAVSSLTVRLRVGPTGTARIEQVYVSGAAWP